MDDVVALIEYIARDNPNHAEQLFDKLKTRTDSLERFPDRGRVVPELGALGVRFLRELVVAPYRILYRVEGDSVHIVAVFDGRRNLADVLFERAFRND